VTPSRGHAISFFNETSAAFDREYATDPNFAERFDLWTSLIATYGTRGGSALDVGCGPGHLSCFAAARGLATIGIDPAPRMLELASRLKQDRGLTNLELRQGTLETVDEQQLHADLVLCSSVLEYLPSLETALTTLRRAVNPGGHLILSLPNAACWYRRLEGLSYALLGRPRYRGLIKHLVAPEQVVQLAEPLGLRAVETRYCATQHALRSLSSILPERRRAALFVMVLHA
jgi:2-polyprenyl-3-methyl-5-hydroxy-6-metoxy-1,4-benzoquinol methylase